MTPANDNSASRPDKPRVVKACPVCGKPSVDEVRPFCSKRCADVDLHRWLGGNYIVPGDETGSSDENDEQ